MRWGCIRWGSAQRLIAELRRAGWKRPIYLHGALRKLTDLYRDWNVTLGSTPDAKAAKKDAFKGEVVLAPASALADKWARRLPDPVICGASGWMTVRQRAKQRGVELPLVISDRSDWDELTTTIRETQAEMVWVTHGAEEGLVHWCHSQGIAALPLAMIGRGQEEGQEGGQEVGQESGDEGGAA